MSACLRCEGQVISWNVFWGCSPMTSLHRCAGFHELVTVVILGSAEAVNRLTRNESTAGLDGSFILGRNTSVSDTPEDGAPTAGVTGLVKQSLPHEAHAQRQTFDPGLETIFGCRK